jgi:hypothetical protein
MRRSLPPLYGARRAFLLAADILRLIVELRAPPDLVPA